MTTLISDVLREEGFETCLRPTKNGVPVAFGELPAAGARRTLLVYDHYDVQPPEPLDLWTAAVVRTRCEAGRMPTREARIRHPAGAAPPAHHIA